MTFSRNVGMGEFHCTVVNMHSPSVDGVIQPVETVRGRSIHWAMLTKDDLERLSNEGQ